MKPEAINAASVSMNVYHHKTNISVFSEALLDSSLRSIRTRARKNSYNFSHILMAKDNQ